MPVKMDMMNTMTTITICHAAPIAALPVYPTRCPTSTWSTMPWTPPMTLVSIVGQAILHTARTSGPSTMERSYRPAGARWVTVGPDSGGQVLELDDRPDLHRPAPGVRNLLGDGDRLVEVLRVDHEVSAQLLPGLRERTVGHLAFARPHPDALCRGRRLQRRGRDVLSGRAQLVGEPGGFVVTVLALGLTQGVLVPVDQQHVFHLPASFPVWCGGSHRNWSFGGARNRQRHAGGPKSALPGSPEGVILPEILSGGSARKQIPGPRGGNEAGMAGVHSVRKVVAGSTLAARQAGTAHAITDTAASSTMTA